MQDDMLVDETHEITLEPSHSTPVTPDIRPSGLPNRKTRRPTRYQDYTDELPPPPPPIVPDIHPEDVSSQGQAGPSSAVYKTPPNQFGVFHVFDTGLPTYVPNEFHSLENLSDSPNFEVAPNTIPTGWWAGFGSSLRQLEETWFAPFLSASTFRLMKWFYGASTIKSLTELDRLVHEVLLAEDFKLEDLRTFRATKEDQRLGDGQDMSFSPADGWLQSSVNIPITAERLRHHNSAEVPQYSVPGLFYRRPLDIIKTALAEPLAQQFHLVPHHTYWTPSPDHQPERIYSEIFSSDVFIQEHKKIHSSPSEDGCQLETIIISLMFWSDSTHLTSFGDASLWPIYMFFGNLSKYVRGKPSTFSAHHLAYIPKACIILLNKLLNLKIYYPQLGDVFQDFYRRRFDKAISSTMLTNCRRELVHAIWLLLLDEDFIHAYKYGFVFDFFDGVSRRVFPRIFTYGMDYPEK